MPRQEHDVVTDVPQWVDIGTQINKQDTTSTLYEYVPYRDILLGLPVIALKLFLVRCPSRTQSNTVVHGHSWRNGEAAGYGQRLIYYRTCPGHTIISA